MHLGMPKTGSTAIQSFLSDAITGFERRNLTFEDVENAVKGPYEFERLINEMREDISGHSYSQAIFHSGEKTIISSENFSYFTGEQLKSFNPCGLAVLRNPIDWIPSMATQDILFSIPSNGANESELFNHNLLSPEAQTIFLYRTYTEKYIGILENLENWLSIAPAIELVSYESERGIFSAVIKSLNSFGVNVNTQAKISRLRISHDFTTAQLGLSVYHVAYNNYGFSRNQSSELMRSALGVSKSLYMDRLTDISSGGFNQIKSYLMVAYQKYQSLLSANGLSSASRKPEIPLVQVLDEKFSNDLSSSILFLAKGYSQVPKDFDAKLYLELNPEVLDECSDIGSAEQIAAMHYQRYGFIEARPVPALASK
jgi:hypothetical protein